MFHVNILKPYYDRGNLVLMARGGQKELALMGWRKKNKGSKFREVNWAPTVTKTQGSMLSF